MRVLSAQELLGIWERGLAQVPAERALELLAAAYPENSRESLAALSLGHRDAQLLRVRQSLFGTKLAGVACCPRCEGRLDLALDVEDFLEKAPQEASNEISLSVAGYELCLRLPNSRDLEEVAGEDDLATTRRMLLERCVLSVGHEGQSISSEALPAEVIEAAGDRMSKADPLADIQVTVSCPECEYHWRLAFDVVAFLWSELDVWASRILRDVHILASAYGWCERDILALSAMRRRFYLEMVAAWATS